MKRFTQCRIETPRLIITPYSLDDLDDLHRIGNDPEVLAFMHEDPMTKADTRRLIEWSMAQNRRNTPSEIHKLNLAVHWREDHSLVGFVGLGPCDCYPKRTELYYATDSAWRGQGIALEAATAVLNFAREQLEIDEVIAFAAADNIGSVRNLIKLGLRYQGPMHDIDRKDPFYGNLLFSFDCR